MLERALSVAMILGVIFVGITLVYLADAQRIWARRRHPMNLGVPVSPLRRGGLLVGGASAALVLIQILHQIR